jgi:hypothetical protein
MADIEETIRNKSMTNQIINDYIERKAKEFDIIQEDRSWGDATMFVSDMVQEIFGALPEFKKRRMEEFADKNIGQQYEDWKDGHNSFRSTFLENINKLK